VIEREHLVRKISDQEAGEARVVVIGRIHAHACAGNAVFAEGDSGNDRFFSKRALPLLRYSLFGWGIIRNKRSGQPSLS